MVWDGQIDGDKVRIETMRAFSLNTRAEAIAGQLTGSKHKVVGSKVSKVRIRSWWSGFGGAGDLRGGVRNTDIRSHVFQVENCKLPVTL